ncbi:hypothetical protein CR513_14438, partial [Mucuna pruriens]
MKIMENLARKEVIKTEEERGNLIKRTYSAMHVKNEVTLHMSATIIKESKRKRLKLRWDKVIVMIRIQTMNLDEKVKRMVKFAGNSTFTVEGMGNVLRWATIIHRRDGQQSFITDVLYVL